MSSFLLTAFLLSIDSLVVAVALSPLVQSPVSRLGLASIFGICDGLAVLLGSALSCTGLSFHISKGAAPFFALLFGLYCVVAAQWKRFSVSPRLVCLMPVLMSFDNLAYGVGIGPVTDGVFAQAVGLAAASLILAALGLYLGSFVRFAGARAREVAAGVGLVTAGLVLSLV